MAKVYIISKIGWEYNDEVYYRGKSEGGTPVKAYRDRERAQAECDIRNLALLKRDIKHYRRSAVDEEEEEMADKYGTVPITEDYEVIAVDMEE